MCGARCYPRRMINALFPFQGGQGSDIERLRSEFYRLLVAPAAIGFIIGWTGAIGERRVASACIWSVLSVTSWLLNDLAARPIAAPLHRRGYPLIIVLLVAFGLSAPFSVLLNLSFGDVFRLWGFERNGLSSLTHLSLGQMASSTIAPLLLWLTINLVACRSNGGKLFGIVWHSEPDASSLSIPSAPQVSYQPAFMKKVRPALRGRVIAVNAELHYVRVFTEHGEDLVLYRFRDAVTDMQRLGGIQVHRSWCVTAQEVANHSARSLTLRNGFTVPIGRAFQRNVSSALM